MSALVWKLEGRFHMDKIGRDGYDVNVTLAPSINVINGEHERIVVTVALSVRLFISQGRPWSGPASALAHTVWLPRPSLS